MFIVEFRVAGVLDQASEGGEGVSNGKGFFGERGDLIGRGEIVEKGGGGGGVTGVEKVVGGGLPGRTETYHDCFGDRWAFEV